MLKSADLDFAEIVELHQEMIYSIAFRMLRNHHDAEDAVQEAFLSACKAFPRFKGDSKVSTWMHRIVVNVCLMKIRRDKVRSKSLIQLGPDNEYLEDQEDKDSEISPEKMALNGELRDVIEDGFSMLAPNIRAAIDLRDKQGYPNQEAAEILQVSVGVFKRRLRRGRLRMREYLQKSFAVA